MRGVLALIVLGLLAVLIAVQAELKATSRAYSWDIVFGELSQGHVTIPWDGTWIPLLHEVTFDHLDRPYDESYPELCRDAEDPDATTTRWAGWIEYGLPLTDTLPVDATGFQDGKNWKLIDCDLNGDGS